jgi:hypothetical protein
MPFCSRPGFQSGLGHALSSLQTLVWSNFGTTPDASFPEQARSLVVAGSSMRDSILLNG